MSNGLDPDQDRQNVGPDLGPNCLQRLSSDDKSATSKDKVELVIPWSGSNTFLSRRNSKESALFATIEAYLSESHTILALAKVKLICHLQKTKMQTILISAFDSRYLECIGVKIFK